MVLVFLTSDCHTNEPENRKLVHEAFFPQKSTNKASSQQTVLIVAGDVSFSLKEIENTLSMLVKRYDHVFFCVGNNELRVERRKRDSMHQFHEIMALCHKIGVKTRSERVDGVWICPIVSWYTPDFFGEDYARKRPNYQRGWLDFRYCHFDEGQPHQFFREWMEKDIERVLREKEEHENVITFSHFLPRRELLSRISVLVRPTFPLVTGNGFIEDCLRRLGSSVHCYGHTHMNGSKVIDGVRYVQHAVAHVGEREQPWYKRLLNGLSPTYTPMLIHQSKM
mmetsp:Transcript_11149/g.41644  ORF Transcript_11149/g.41644 Transcript_11149/m.41644 type:complete len:280 (-) Transcript_11149:1130-1969(-)